VTEQLDVDYLSETDDYHANLTLPNNITYKNPGAYGGVVIEPGTTLSFPNGTDQNASSLTSLFLIRQDSEARRFRATEFAFHWCVNSYAVNITDNVLDVNLVGSSAHTEYGETHVRLYNITQNMTYLITDRDLGVKYPVGGNGVSEIAGILEHALTGNYTDYGAPSFGNGAEIFAASLHANTLINLGYNHTSTEEFDEGEWVAMDNMTRNLATSLTNA
jgi:hypothetical protein